MASAKVNLQKSNPKKFNLLKKYFQFLQTFIARKSKLCYSRTEYPNAKWEIWIQFPVFTFH